MKNSNKIILISLLLTGSFLSGFSQNRDVIAGRWLNAEKDIRMQIYLNSGKFSGKIIWLKNKNDENGKEKLDKRNPDPALSRRPLVGTEILKGFSYQPGDTWEGGTLYDPKTGKTYKCIISILNRDKMNVRGFVGISALGRTETWSRIQ